ncbi:unnamed protein product [Symbiodinium sp. CCMP2592]|nr:unnamed protein product [Symbiodinium sp. CCMP2592]
MSCLRKIDDEGDEFADQAVPSTCVDAHVLSKVKEQAKAWKAAYLQMKDIATEAHAPSQECAVFASAREDKTGKCSKKKGNQPVIGLQNLGICACGHAPRIRCRGAVPSRCPTRRKQFCGATGAFEAEGRARHEKVEERRFLITIE